ncbi:MAG: flagellar basal body rod protein FlgC [bacterium]
MGLFHAMNVSTSGMTAQRVRQEVITNNIANATTTRTERGGPYRRKMVIFQARDYGPRITIPPLMRVLGQGTAVRIDDREITYKKGNGVRVKSIVEDPSPFKRVYEPSHPDADGDGYVLYPNVDIVTEMVNMIETARAYEANVSAHRASKDILQSALQIIA